MRESILEVEPGRELVVPPEDIRLFLEYIEQRDTHYEKAAQELRTRDEALAYCEHLKVEVGMNSTKLEGWTNSPGAMVAAVTNIAKLVCQEKAVPIEPKPQRRCLWLIENDLHVSARNLDGAIPALAYPKIVWEIKEYWGGGEGKEGGSKMSDAVYEINLVGRELREYEDRSGHPHVEHIVFLDGKQQWSSRDSDLKKMIDLFNQGIIDYLFLGREVETGWANTLTSLL